MMDEDALIDLMVEHAMGYLAYDDAHPEVGMGMMYETAIECAEKDILKEAARWNSLEALRLQFTEAQRSKAKKIITVKRQRR